MPSVSAKQHRAMEAAAHGHSNLGIPASVGKEFEEADKGRFTGDNDWQESKHPRAANGQFGHGGGGEGQGHSPAPIALEDLRDVKKELGSIAQARPEPSKSQQEALKKYQGHSWQQMNNRLRFNKEWTDETRDLAAWLNNASLPRDTVLYRGVKRDYAKQLISANVGDEFTDKGFMSTSASPGIANVDADVLLQIEAKKGQHAAAISPEGQDGGEYEVLVAPGSTLRVTGHSEQTLYRKKIKVVTCELVQEDKGASDKSNFSEDEDPVVVTAVAAAATIFEAPDGAILLVLRSQQEPNYGGYWALPGGKGEPGESPLETACRESDEELGVECRRAWQGEPTLVGEAVTRTGINFSTFLQPVRFRFYPTLNGEHSGFAWVSPHQLPSPIHPGVLETIQKVYGNVGVDEASRPKLSKSEVDYSPGKGDERCSRCIHFIEGGRCEVVKGLIDPDYWCEEFEFNVASDNQACDAIAMDKSSVRQYDADGHLHVERTPISKAVINPYYGREIPNYRELHLEPDRIYKLYRDPEELARAASTFAGKPLLSTHTPVNADSHPKSVVVGTIGDDVQFEGPYLTAPLTVWDGDAIKLIEADEQRELSCGYKYDPDMTPGEVDGELYDGVMRNIRGNHVALVEEGRAGPDVLVQDGALKMANDEWSDEAREKAAEARRNKASLKAESEKRQAKVESEAKARAEKVAKSPALAKATNSAMSSSGGPHTPEYKSGSHGERLHNELSKAGFKSSGFKKGNKNIYQGPNGMKAAISPGGSWELYGFKSGPHAEWSDNPSSFSGFLEKLRSGKSAQGKDGALKMAKDAGGKDGETVAKKEDDKTEDELSTGANSAMPTNGVKAKDEDPGREFLKSKLSAEDMKAYDELMSKEDEAEDEEEDDDAEDENEAEREANEGEGERLKEREEKEKGQDKAMDAAIRAAVRGTEKRVAERVRQAEREIRAAEKDCLPYVGDMGGMVFDSAPDVYRHALKILDVPEAETIHESALKTVLHMQPKAGSKPTRVSEPAMAADASMRDAAVKFAPGLANITIGV